MRIWIDVPASAPAEECRSRRDELVLKHLKLVRTLAVRIRRKLPAAVDPNDLFQAGVVGLLKAMETYDVSKDGDFGIYAGRRIKATIIDSLSQLDGAPRMQGRHRRLHDAAVSPPAAEPVAGVSLESGAAGALPVAGLLRDANWMGLDVAAGPESQPDQICERNELRLTIGKAIGRLPQRHREVFVWFYENGMTAKEISERLRISECRVSQIRRKALQEMSAALEAGGFAPRRYADNSRAVEGHGWIRLSILPLSGIETAACARSRRRRRSRPRHGWVRGRSRQPNGW